MPLPSAILFDIGQVLVHFDFSLAARAITAAGAPHPDPLAALDLLKPAHEDGSIDDKTFLAQAAAAIDMPGGPDALAPLWCEVFSPNILLAPLLPTLAAKVPLFLLSNTSKLHRDYLFDRFPLFRHFTAGMYSYAARSSKPHPTIYHCAIECFHLDPSTTFYFDDLPENVAAGRAAGLQALLYEPAHHHRSITPLAPLLA
jgi:glucose-1-phosphatase